MRSIPFSVAVNWPTPNYINPETRGAALFATEVTLIILVTLAVVARLWSRAHINKWFGLVRDFQVLPPWCTPC
jgi:hypothetical protein